MTTQGFAAIAAVPLLAAALAVPPGVLARQDEPAEAAGPDSREAIDREFQEGLVRLEKQRLERLAKLAAGQPKGEADATYADYFRSAIADGLYREAEPTAERLLKMTGTSTEVTVLAGLVNMVAEADRGAYRESLDSLAALIGVGKAGAGAERPRVELPMASRVALLDAYFQRLVRADQFEIAREAFRLVAENARAPAVKDLATNRLRRLDLVGRPAPTIAGEDVDGKPVRPDDTRGDVVLVVFWATWCLPNAQEVAWIDEVYDKYRDRGFRVLGINVDAMQEGGPSAESLKPAIRRFLLDHNVRWPNLINGQGDRDYARAYGVAEIPANALIGRDGRVIHLDLNRGNLEKAVAKALGGG